MRDTIELQNSWECYTPDMAFLNCRDCAQKFAEDNGVELNSGAHNYGDNGEGTGISECWACSHEFDTPPTCDACHVYLNGDLTREGLQYLKERPFPKWLKDHYLSNN
jgi:hypothetical protein